MEFRNEPSTVPHPHGVPRLDRHDNHHVVAVPRTPQWRDGFNFQPEPLLFNYFYPALFQERLIFFHVDVTPLQNFMSFFFSFAAFWNIPWIILTQALPVFKAIIEPELDKI